MSSPIITEGDDIDFAPRTSLPAHFTYWRFPIPDSFAVSPAGHPNTLRLKPSVLNLTALNGNYAGPTGQTFVGRRQQDTLFTYSVDLDFSPSVQEEEAGVTVFLTQNHHLDMGVVMLPANSSTAAFPGTNRTVTNSTVLAPHIRFRGISYIPVPDPVVVPLPTGWADGTLRLEIKASNATHYAFSVGPADAMSEMRTILYASNAAVSWGFTGKSGTMEISRLRGRDFLTDYSACRHDSWHLQYEQWRTGKDGGLLLEVVVHAPGTVPVVI